MRYDSNFKSSYTILLNGRKVREPVVEADTDEGWIKIITIAELAGRVTLEPKIITGKVEVVPNR